MASSAKHRSPYLQELADAKVPKDVQYLGTTGRAANPAAQSRRQKPRREETSLFGRYLAASEAAPDVIGPRDVVALTISTIHAGSETVALNASGALSYALSDLPIFRKSERENQAAGVQPSVPLRFADVEKLPYLDALLPETLFVYDVPLKIASH